MKEAVSNSSYPSKQRSIPVERLKRFSQHLQAMNAQIEEVLQREQEEKLLERAEMEHKKATNLIACQGEIHSRAPRVWFQSEQDKKRLKNESRKQFKGQSKREKNVASK